MTFFTLKDFNFKHKKVLVRVDFNVPLDKQGNITNDERIKAAIPTIKFLLNQQAKVILLSHLGRPDGKVIKELSLKKVATHLGKLLKTPILMLSDCVNIEIPDDKIIMLENLRFHPEEEKNDKAFAKKLIDSADYYVNDAFGCSHRAHASVHAITEYLPSCAGFLLEKEINNLTLDNPKRPMIGILGGSKISDKIELINELLKKVDKLLLGGAMIFTFYKAGGLEIGKSLVEKDKAELAKQLMNDYKDKLILPVDVVVAGKMDAKAIAKTVPIENMPKNMIGLDIGEKSIQLYKNILKDAKTIVWNGPLGVFEIEKFAIGTFEIAKALSKSKAKTIVGGGDSLAAVQKLKLESKMTHVSTGGGAFIEFIEGRKLPGIDALEKNYEKFKQSLALF
jgi:phosphoglycerate kinase